MSRGALCKQCPLYKRKNGPVPTKESKKPLLYILSQEPGPDEVDSGEPFMGRSGKQLNKALWAAGLDREDVTIANAVECRVPEKGGLASLIKRQNAAYKRSLARYKADLKDWQKTKQGLPPSVPEKPLTPYEACFPRVQNEIKHTQAPAIVGMGSAAHKAIAAVYGLKIATRQKPGDIGNVDLAQGHPYKLPDGRIYTATKHFAWALREKKTFLRIIREQIGYAAHWARKGFVWTDPDGILGPTYKQAKDFLQAAYKNGSPIFCDIETDSLEFDAKMRCIGLGYKDKQDKIQILVLPLILKNGQRYWKNHAQYLELKQLTCKLLDDLPVVMHNATFDSRVLRRYGFMSTGDKYDLKPLYCTLTMHKNTREVDALHGLGFVSQRFMHVPNWKTDVDLKSVGNEDDLGLWKYNKIDIWTTGIVFDGLLKWIKRDRTQKQNKVDSALLPILRNMTELGVPVYVPELEQRSFELKEKLDEKREKLFALAGCEINLNSGKQLAELIFDKWKNNPVINTDSFKFEKGDTPATSIQALMAVQDAKCDKRTYDFIDNLVEYKTLEKLRSSFVDNLLKANDPSVKRDDPITFLPTEFDGFYMQHPNWVLYQTPTGRFACRNRNWQNVPKRAAGGMNLRTIVRALPGHVFVSYDFSQLEARLLAGHLPDPLMIDAFEKGYDVHSLNYATLVTENETEMWAKYHEMLAWKRGEVGNTEKERKFYKGCVGAYRLIAKIFVFAMFYGADLNTMHDIMVSARDKATQKKLFPNHTIEDTTLWYENFHKARPWSREWNQRCARKAYKQGWTGEEIHGRKRWFDGGPSKKNAPTNMEIQASAAALANKAILQIAQKIGHRSWSKYSGVILQVHDEIVAQVPIERALEANEIFKEAMRGEYNGVKIEIEGEISEYWTGPDISERLQK